MSATALVVSFVLATVVAASPSDLAVDAKGDGFDLQAIDVSADGSVYRPRNVDGSPASVEFRRMPASICFTQDFPTS
ncbi:hypothetical protein, partial [Oerskovia turbata]